MSRLKTENEIIELIKNTKGDSYQYIGRDMDTKKIKILHTECGNIWETTLSNLPKRRCSKCTYSSSIFSNIVENELIKNNINYHKEISFDDCKNIKKLKFDFGIYDLDNNLLFIIECDGEQHYKETKYFRDYELIRLRDTIKNNYCEENKIIIHRIKYDSIDNISYIVSKLLVGVVRINYERELINILNPLVNKDFCSFIRKKYLDIGNIKKLSNEYKKSEKLIQKIINYEYCQNYDLDIKQEVLSIYEKSRPKNRFFKDLTQEEINEMVELKRKGLTDLEISKRYGLNRKSMKINIPNWGEITPNHLIKGKSKKVIHLSDGVIFNSLIEACKYYGYKYVNEIQLIRNNSNLKKFMWC